MSRTIQQLFDLRGKTALVTGGSRGLGLQLARALGEAGATLMLSSRKAQDLEGAAAELRAQGIDARWIAADCAKDAEIHRLADATLAQFGHLDILVNNAGASWGAPAEDHPVDAWDKVMNLNVRGYFLLSQRIAKNSMIPRRSGRIINVASIAGLNGNTAAMTTIAYNIQRRGDQFHPHLGRGMGQVQHHRQRDMPGLFPQQNDGWSDGIYRRRPDCRRCAAATSGRR